MKTYLILLFILLLSGACGSNEEAEEKNAQAYAEIEFENKVFDFGTLTYDSDGRCYFEFTNVSKTPLIINTVRTTCGCTRPEWPENPVPPGESGRIGISYNTRISGTFHKGITVYSNTLDSPSKLYVKGKVQEKIETP